MGQTTLGLMSQVYSDIRYKTCMGCMCTDAFNYIMQLSKVTKLIMHNLQCHAHHRLQVQKTSVPDPYLVFGNNQNTYK